MHALPLLLSAALLAAGCDPTPGQAGREEIQEQLVGTWLREYEQDGARVRRILVLEPDGRSHENSRNLGPAAAGERHQHEGRWLFDGTNLKRHYSLIDGKPTATPTVPFAAFQIEFTGSHEFTGTDNVRHRRLRYERVADGTEP
jgi:hypothetical protein